MDKLGSVYPTLSLSLSQSWRHRRNRLGRPFSFRSWIFLFLFLLCHVALISAQDNEGTNMEVDDTDPSIEYSPGWVLISTNTHEAFDGTEHLNRLQGGTANFTFIGVGVSVFGTIVPQSTFGGNITQSTYFLDDEPDGVSFTVPENITTMSSRVLFYQSPANLTNGTHTLRIVNDNEDDWYLLDFLQVLSPDSPQSIGSSNYSTSSQPVNGASTSPVGSSLTTTTAAQSDSAPTMSSSSGHTIAPVSLVSHQEPISPGAAVGIAFSCAVVLGILTALFIIIFNRRRRRKTELERLTAIDPFVAGFLAAAHEPKGEFSPPASPAAADTSAHGMFYPYVVEFFSRGPRSLKSMMSPSSKSARSLKVNVGSMPSQSSSSQVHVQPVLRTLPTQLPVLAVQTTDAKRRSARRSTKYSFLSKLNFGPEEKGEISPTSRSTTEVHMGIAL